MGASTPQHLETRVGKLRKLTEVSRALTYARCVDEVLSLAVHQAAELLDAGKVVLMLADADGVLSVRASRGVEAGACDAFHEPVGGPFLERVRGVLGTDAGERFLGVPLVVGGDVTGLLAVARRDDGSDPEEGDWLLSALADQVSVALEKSRLDETALFRERLLGIVGHDLRNPLQAILMGTNFLLTSGTIGVQETKVVGRIATSAGRMVGLIDELLDFTRARLGGGIVLELAQTALAPLCEQVVEELALGNPAATIVLEARSAPEGTWDRARLAQVLSNLVKNAVQHGRRGGTVRVRCHEEAGEAIVGIHNEGPPIAPALLPRLFDPFRQGAAPKGRAATSMGLGLYIAQQVVRAHGGRLEVVSTEEHGTTFTASLPLNASPTVRARLHARSSE